MKRLLQMLVAVSLLCAPVLTSPAWAMGRGPHHGQHGSGRVPEIDAGSAPAALALLAVGVVMLASGRRRR